MDRTHHGRPPPQGQRRPPTQGRRPGYPSPHRSRPPVDHQEESTEQRSRGNGDPGAEFLQLETARGLRAQIPAALFTGAACFAGSASEDGEEEGEREGAGGGGGLGFALPVAWRGRHERAQTEGMSSNQPAKLTMKTMFLSLLVLSYSVASFHCSTVPENTTDMFSLLRFKQAITSDPTGILSYWNSSTSFCQWEGITCSRKHAWRVVALHLTGLTLSGQISSSLGNLTFLKELNLSSNSLSGQLPSLNRLHKLQILDLSRNSFHGTIPDALSNCSNLQTLYLQHNSLIGNIPPKLGLLSNLVFLWLGYNNLTGTIPSAFSNISNMQTLRLTDNQLEGSIPDLLGKLSKMQRLTLGANKLTGGFPHGLFNLSKSLQVLGLEMNRLGNTLPPNVGDALPNLQMLLLNRNIFQGNIPASLGNASGLGRLELEHNKFTGQIPTSFEYAHSGQASTSGDVFSFGILLLEMLTGKRPTDSMFQNELSIVSFAERHFPDQILQIVDVHLQEECEGYIQATTEIGNVVTQCLLSLVQVALSCTSMIPKERTNMREVTIKLRAIRTSYVGATRREEVMAG
ncbi:hypothetical protein QYE76_004542 [Lolium multiflorum]|uniref:Leucine-rich repeat-containing N-terminal plant-type domain-containing protein n=1 Tax=Lolium multiflorum TaxID=4521 RepID=A0AAD8W0C6_LOLMU|nr:hypothetical protein QYE76_004542 [Lolium multiflorum]